MKIIFKMMVVMTECDDHLVLLDLVDHRDVVLSTLHFPTAEMIDNW